jgi:glycosyltransferase involved in cell wall biosynthesis
VISRHDAGTGIQRVVRALALALMDVSSSRWEIRFVGASRRRPYHDIAWPDPSAIVDPTEMEGRVGDVFLGLDFSLDAVRFHRRQLARFRRRGGQLSFIICDLLPIERPEWFSPNTVVRYKAWLEILAGVTDDFLSISQQTQDELIHVLDKHYGLVDGYRTSLVPMGSNIKESMLRPVIQAESLGVPIRFDISAPFSLIVGTLEPRKGHADILAGFNELWQQGSKEQLVLVGRMGWRTEALRDAILAHPRYGRELRWFDDVEDPELEQIYQACQGVILGSHAEGFGLPLIEALEHGKPVLARDLPIFRIHENFGVQYFPVDASPQSIADAVRQWTRDVQADKIPVVPPSASWKDSAKAIFSAIA